MKLHVRSVAVALLALTLLVGCAKTNDQGDSGAVVDTGGPNEISDTGEPVAIRGVLTCLLRADGSPDDSCSIGLQADDGQHYGFVNVNAAMLAGKTEPGRAITVTGTLSAMTNDRYQAAGIISVTDIQ